MKSLRLQLLFLTILGSAFLSIMHAQLQFTGEGTFKIVQLTDMHLGCKSEGVNSTLDFMREVLDNEKPDLVMFTGDIVVRNNPKEIWDQLASILSERKIRWAVVLGNHDDEYDTKRAALVDMFTAYPGCLNQRTSGVEGETNFILPVLNNQKQPVALLYGFDSHAYSKISGVKGYNWFQLSQLNWYRTKSAQYTQNNQNKPLPALAFFHIPFPEYNEIEKSRKTPVLGQKKEKVACGQVNGGLFGQLLAGGDVMGTFVGHDHVNDYIGVLHGIALAYGRFSNPTGCPYGKINAGARVIVLKENQRTFDTWIRELGGKIEDQCTYPDSFVTDKKK